MSDRVRFAGEQGRGILDPHFKSNMRPVSAQTSMKDIYIADLANFDEGRPFDSFFLVLMKQQRTTKTNKPYWNLILGDKTGQIEGRIWDPSDPRIAKVFERGDIVKARGCASNAACHRLRYGVYTVYGLPFGCRISSARA